MRAGRACPARRACRSRTARVVLPSALRRRCAARPASTARSQRPQYAAHRALAPPALPSSNTRHPTRGDAHAPPPRNASGSQRPRRPGLIDNLWQHDSPAADLRLRTREDACICSHGPGTTGPRLLSLSHSLTLSSLSGRTGRAVPASRTSSEPVYAAGRMPYTYRRHGPHCPLCAVHCPSLTPRRSLLAAHRPPPRIAMHRYIYITTGLGSADGEWVSWAQTAALDSVHRDEDNDITPVCRLRRNVWQRARL